MNTQKKIDVIFESLGIKVFYYNLETGESLEPGKGEGTASD